MQLIFTGPVREAVALHRILNADGIDAVCMTGTDHPTGAVFVPAEDADDRATIDRAIERMKTDRDAKADGATDADTRKRAPDSLYWRAYTEMRAAHARVYPFQQMDPPFEHEDVEWACAESLAKLGPIMQEVQDAKGMCIHAVERALELAGALLLGMRALALVLGSPGADRRGQIRTDDIDFPADNAIGWLLMLLDELASEAAPERWMSEDERGLEPGGICGAEDNPA